MSTPNDPGRGSGPERRDDRRDERLAAYTAGTLPEAEARSLENEILADPALAAELYGDVNVAAAIAAAAGTGGAARAADGAGAAKAAGAAAAARKIVPIDRPWVRRHLRVVVPLAAAAMALLVLVPRGEKTGPDDETFRGDTAARLLEPVGALDAAPSVFTWSRDEGAALYRLELYDAEAELRFRATTPDTTLTLPADALGDLPFTAGYWKVIPMTDAGVERPGPPPASIRVRGGK